MLIQLKCENCNAPLELESNGRILFCENCGSRYIFAEQKYISGDKYAEIDRLAMVLQARKKQIEYCDSKYQRQIDEEDEKERQRLATVDQKAYWIRNKLCRHCGGTFEGHLFKRCGNCGRYKDY